MAFSDACLVRTRTKSTSSRSSLGTITQKLSIQDPSTEGQSVSANSAITDVEMLDVSNADAYFSPEGGDTDDLLGSDTLTGESDSGAC